VEPADRVVPGLADDERSRLHPLHTIAEGAPEAVIDLVRDVQPPSVDVGLANPFLADADQVLAQLGVRGVELRMAPCAIREGLVVDRVEVHRKALDPKEPVAVLARLALLANVLEREPPVARVVEDTIEEHADVAAIRVADQRRENLVRTEARIDALV